ncbi:uncharacterized protein YprB with RNaseH-like and TPR domain [Bacillus pakistanensis]|uniref:Uncharacterized protein YprB with RNaseH-like and TPR domain n=1 Tax=Rossellomorea pakistanensis TaxID=992288 RepID=A0ABS2N962_9BACI|nr:ribonuclease H-like domain-containing protein [Bacillus pakistanensis]MBM7584299.1 uncharacterized protein YprB with RNaseH-like and TPR domain [Bacillus pakistanensis]
MSIKSKLNRMKKHIVTEAAAPIIENRKTLEIPNEKIWENANVRPYFLDDDYCLIREVRYKLEECHGKYSFKDFLNVVEKWQGFDGSHPLSAKGLHPSQIFFFDTETTGLGGGAGNMIFLLGYAQFNEKELILKQHLLPSPGNEIPLYYSFLENIDYTTLVTYNGKAFDWPQVKTRHTLIRDHVPKLPSFGHFDLYHAARRMWKDELESVKLSNVEKKILQFHRKGDVPGYLAPMIYFDFVERKDPEGVLKVMSHNELDILSLITLYTHLSLQILGLDHNQTSKEKWLVGKWFDYVGEEKLAVQHYQKVMHSVGEEKNLASYALALHFKKEKAFDEAVVLWNKIFQATKDQPLKIKSLIELAKVYEHYYKDYKKAISYANEAYKSLTENDHNSSEKVLIRIKRLNRKLSK